MNEITMPNGDRVVVEPWDETPSYRLQNLARVASDGEVIWRAELPDGTSPDCFVAVRLEGGSLIAATWSGYSTVLDPTGGKHLGSTFVK